MFASKIRFLVPIVGLLAGGLLFLGCEQMTTPAGMNESSSDNPSLSQHQSAPPAATPQAELAGVRRASAPYHNLDKAKQDGYLKFSVFVPNMGFHYLHASAIDASNHTYIEDGTLERTEPEILVYGDVAQGNSTTFNNNENLGAVEYAIRKQPGSSSPPAEAVNLFSGADAGDWHVHPSVHELPPPVRANYTAVVGECHYEDGRGLMLAKHTNGDRNVIVPFNGQVVATWDSPAEVGDCPAGLPGPPAPTNLRVFHGRLWTLHAWVWVDNPEGTFHPTNPRVTK